MMDILVYEYLLTPVIISPMLKQFLWAKYILITHFLSVEIGYVILYVLEVAIDKHFKNCLLKILKWNFEVSRVQISFFQVPYIYYISLPIIMIKPSVCLTVLCHISFSFHSLYFLYIHIQVKTKDVEIVIVVVIKIRLKYSF